MEQQQINQFKNGFILGIPIMLGYIPVAFTYGSIAVNGGLSPLSATLISLTNLTSSGQFAATNLIFENAAIAEIILVTFIINIRYMLMSLSLSQKLERMPMWKKAIFAFGVTDEIFAIASTQQSKITFRFMMGLIVGPLFGWTFGTALGTFAMNFIPEIIKNAMGIALYGMFISIIIPQAKRIKPVLKVLIFSSILSAILFYIPAFSFISSGVSIIIIAILGALFGAKFFPIEYIGSEDK